MSVVIVERGENGFGAYVPDLPGCAAVGEAREEALGLIGESVELHLEGLREDGLPIPEPSSSSEYVEVGVARPALDDRPGYGLLGLPPSGRGSVSPRPCCLFERYLLLWYSSAMGDTLA